MENYLEKFGALCGAFANSRAGNLVESLEQSLSPHVRWERWRGEVIDESAAASAGLCLNILRAPAKALDLLWVKFDARGCRRLTNDSGLQHAIAHAYWQTAWAAGALRSERGQTVPVAFAAIDRSFASAETPPLEIHQDCRQQFIIGARANRLARLRRAAAAGKLFRRQGHFAGDLLPEDVAWLDAHAFIDRYIGDNTKAAEPDGPLRLVFVGGSQLIGNLLADENGAYLGKATNLGNVVAATNSGFFLNFPEEYDCGWCAMNDPVGLLIRKGEFLQLPLMRRGALLVSSSGAARISLCGMENVGFRLPWEDDLCCAGARHGFVLNVRRPAEGEVAVYTPACCADQKPGRQTTPASNRIELVVVFGEIVEVRQGGAAEIPPNGIVISLPAPEQTMPRVLSALEKYGNRVAFECLAGTLGLDDVETALGAGPILLEKENIIPANYFTSGDEEFLSLLETQGTIERIGLPPTRFPHDAADTRAPRTVLGLTAAGEIILALIDGRNGQHSLGATLQEAGRILAILGCTHGLNLDGGGSSVLHLTRKDLAGAPLQLGVSPGIVNLPSDAQHRERLLPVALLFRD